MDGTLVENDRAHSQAFVQLLKEHGVMPEPNRQGIIQTPGLATYENTQRLKEKYQLKPSVEELAIRKKAIYSKLFKTCIRLADGAEALLEELQLHGIEKAIASGSSRETIVTTVSHLAIDQYFKALVSTFEVGHPKPEPHVFLHAANALGVPPEDCVVIGDTAFDVLGATAAGMPSVFIPNPYIDHDPGIKPTLQVASMTQLSWAKLMQL